MSKFQHAICDECWERRNPDRLPVRLMGSYRKEERCCFCLAQTKSGIYVRENPADMPCNGVHDED